MARPVNPNSRYTVKPHVTHGHIYASTQPAEIDPETGKKVYKYIHWGKVIDNVFLPGANYVQASLEERRSLVFPSEWDISAIETLSGMRQRGRPEYDDEDLNRLYGDVWLLDRIAEQTGVRKDLLQVFGNNQEVVDAILTLAYFPYLTKYNYNRVERWQKITRTPADRPLSPKEITLLTQKITEQNRMDFLRLRMKRLGRNEVCAVDSTTRSAYGDSLCDIKWGRNKERVPLEQTTEVVVYSLTSHQPVYYRTFPGNIPDSRSLQTIIDDLADAGFAKTVLITDRGYDCLKNLETYIQRGQDMVMCMKTSQKMVSEKIMTFGKFDHTPEEMELSLTEKIYFKQYEMEYDVAGLRGQRKKADRFKLNLYLNPVRRSSEKLAVDLQVGVQRQALTEMLEGKAVLDDDHTLKKLYNFFNISYDKSTRVISDFEANQQKIDNARKLSGFYALGTLGVDFAAMEAWHHYRLRDEQEKYFEQMKGQMVSDRQRNWSEEGKTGRLFILFVSMTISSQVRHVWKNTELRQKFSSSLEILDEMRSIRYIEHKHGNARITPFVGKQLDICREFGFAVPDKCNKEYVSKRMEKPKRGRPRKPCVESL